MSGSEWNWIVILQGATSLRPIDIHFNYVSGNHVLSFSLYMSIIAYSNRNYLVSTTGQCGDVTQWKHVVLLHNWLTSRTQVAHHGLQPCNILIHCWFNLFKYRVSAKRLHKHYGTCHVHFWRERGTEDTCLFYCNQTIWIYCDNDYENNTG